MQRENLQAVATTGIGSPDYTTEISQGLIRPGITSKHNQQLNLFQLTPQSLVLVSAYVWVTAAIAASGSAHVIDTGTGVATPSVVPAGFSLTLFEVDAAFDQNWEAWLFVDSYLFCMIASGRAGEMATLAPVQPFSTLPLGVLAGHTVDVVVYNLSTTAVMTGSITVSTLIVAEATPPFPTVKTTKCPFCGTTKAGVSIHELQIICPNCGKTYLLLDFNRGR